MNSVRQPNSTPHFTKKMQTNNRSPVPQDGEPLLRIAIIGGGIVGVSLTLGLLRLPNIQVKLYEQASTLREIGAGVAFTTNAQRCMELLSPHVIASMRAVSTKNEDPYYTYVDGYHSPQVPEGQNNSRYHDMKETQLFRLFAGNTGFDACHRAHFLDEMVKHLPESVVQFRKRLVMYEKHGDGYMLRFEDGTLDTAEAIIGCDGIKSRVRQVLLGVDNPASYPGFTHQVAFRGLIRMDRAVEVLGKDKAHNQCMHMGPGAHMLNFPVAQHTLMNVVAFGAQAKEWTHEKMVAPASREEVLEIFHGWCPAVTAIAGLLGEVLDEDGVSTRASLDKWAIFDTYDNPAPTYADECVCIAGDAAHATSPHHGAGAGMGIEDGLALATVLEQAIKTIRDQPEARRPSKSEVVSAAFAAYNRVRRDRTQWLVRSSREVSRTYEWADPDCGMNPEKCLKDIEWRAHKIWYFDIEGMIKELVSSYHDLLSQGSRPSTGIRQEEKGFIKFL